MVLLIWTRDSFQSLIQVQVGPPGSRQFVERNDQIYACICPGMRSGIVRSICLMPVLGDDIDSMITFSR
jgi:hypothetical protein